MARQTVQQIDRCEWCKHPFPHTRGGRIYCTARCRKLACENRKRVAKRMAAYAFPVDVMKDIETVRKFSVAMADCIMKVCNVAGRDLGEEVLDSVWDILSTAGLLDTLPLASVKGKIAS